MGASKTEKALVFGAISRLNLVESYFMKILTVLIALPLDGLITRFVVVSVHWSVTRLEGLKVRVVAGAALLRRSFWRLIKSIVRGIARRIRAKFPKRKYLFESSFIQY